MIFFFFESKRFGQSPKQFVETKFNEVAKSTKWRSIKNF